MQPAEIIALVAGLTGLVGGLGALLKGRGETRKANADANHSAVDTAGDAVALVREIYEARIAALEKSIAALRAERESDRLTIIDLNRQIGALRQAGEVYSQQVGLLRKHIGEVLAILRDNSIPLPKWAQGEGAHA